MCLAVKQGYMSIFGLNLKLYFKSLVAQAGKAQMRLHVSPEPSLKANGKYQNLMC